MAEFSDVEWRLLVLLGGVSDGRASRPGNLGIEIWSRKPDTPHRKPQHYARSAGKALRSLERRGYAECRSDRGGEFGWMITAAGLAAIGAAK